MDDEAKKFMRELLGEFSGDIKESIRDLNSKVEAIQEWKPELEARVSDLQEAVGALQRAVPGYQPHVIIDIPEPAGRAADKNKAAAPIAPIAPWRPSSRPNGHGEHLQSRGQFSGTTPGTGLWRVCVTTSEPSC